MSTSYYVQTEVKTKNGWECVDPYLPKDGRWVLTTTYENGSRSYFSSTFDELRELGTVNPDDLSEAVLKIYPLNEDKDEENIFSRYEYLKNNRVAVPLKVIQDHLPKNGRKQHCGFYHKDRIYEFENGDRDDLFECEADPEEYAKLPPEMREKLYVFYEWDEPWEWPIHFKTILEEANKRINVWKNMHQLWFEEIEARIIVFCY